MKTTKKSQCDCTNIVEPTGLEPESDCKPKPALQYILEGELPFLNSFSDPSIPKLFQKVKS